MTTFQLRIAAIVVAPALLLTAAACSSTSGSSNGSSSSASSSSSSSSSASGVATPSPTTVDGVTVSGPTNAAPVITVAPNTPAPTKLVVDDIVVGTGAAATADSTVSVQYSGVLLATGKAFNSSWADNAGQPATFPVGQVIPGWQKGIPEMKVGGRRLLIIPAADAYGAAGSPPVIPPNAALVFVVDLVAVK